MPDSRGVKARSMASCAASAGVRWRAGLDMAFASNLLGAMVGGAVEYLALITGYQALLLVVAGLYAAAYVLANLLVDLSYGWLDPRIRLDRRSA